MLRYTVIKPIKYKGEIYEPGDLLPATFTKKDKERHLWSRRIIPIEVEEQEVKNEEPNMAVSEPIEIPETVDPSIEVNKIAENKDIQKEISKPVNTSKVNPQNIPVKSVNTAKK